MPRWRLHVPLEGHAPQGSDDLFFRSDVICRLPKKVNMRVRFCHQTVHEVDVFYREAGAADAPVVLLLHGFPSASHMFRDLIPLLADSYRVIAPALPGFG